MKSKYKAMVLSCIDPRFQSIVYNYLKDSFDVLYKEGETNPKMMSVGLHCRIVGKPGRLKSLERFLDYVLEHKNVWICKRIDIAKHWIKNYSNI